MNEKRLWDYIFNNIGHLGHFNRVETHESSAGYPDVNYCIGGNVGHLELKVGSKRQSLKLRPSQSAWFRSRVKAGGKPFLIYAYDTSKDVVFGIIPGEDVADLVKTVKLDDWIKKSMKIWHDKIEWDEFLHLINVG